MVPTVPGIANDGRIQDGDLVHSRGVHPNLVEPAGCAVGVHVREGSQFWMSQPKRIYGAPGKEADGQRFVPKDKIPPFSVAE